VCVCVCVILVLGAGMPLRLNASSAIPRSGFAVLRSDLQCVCCMLAFANASRRTALAS